MYKQRRRAVTTKRRIIAVLLLAALLMSLCGCFLAGNDELYSLPKPPEDYLDLQSCIDVLLADGAQYSGPVSGSNQQAVQLVDLDGDGVQEALAFLSVTGEKPLRVHFFRKNQEGQYEQTTSVSGDGAAFDSVEYTDVDGDGALEMIIGFQMSEQVLQYISVYDLIDDGVSVMASGSYHEYKTYDMDGDGATEILLFKLDSPETAGTADYLDYRDGEMKLINTATLSLGMEAIKRIKNNCCLEGGEPAIFVTGSYQTTGVVTDVFAVRDRELVNVAIPEGADTSLQTVKNYIIYSSDVDGDGVTELARPTQMPVYEEAGTEIYYTMSWYSQTIDGQWIKKLTTYHNYSESYFFIIPDQWVGSISVSRTDSGRGKALTFYRYDGAGTPEPLMIIYALTSDDRDKLAEVGERFVLGLKTDVTYAAEIAPGADKWEYMLSQDEIIANFKTIRTEWNTGEIK